MGIKRKIVEKALDTQATLAGHAQIKFVHWLMKEESVDYDTAIAIVEGRTDPPEYDYMLGYKLSDPVLTLALFGQLRKDRRIQAAKNFADTLSDPERKLFYSDVFNEKTGQKFKKALKNGGVYYIM